MTAAASPKPVWLVVRLTASLGLIVAGFYAVDWTLRAENLPVQHVRFEGPFQHVTQQALERAVLEHVRGNFLLVDLEAIKREVERIPWVHRASVRRQFPHDIAVRFTEQQLAARWGADAWVNTSGEVVHLTGTDLPAGLPRLQGPERSAAEVLAAFGEFRAALAPLERRLVAVELAPRRSWRLVLEDAAGQPLALVLDYEQPRARLERFARVYAAALAPQAGAIRQVDLRYTNGFAVEWHAGGTARVARTVEPRNEG